MRRRIRANHGLLAAVVLAAGLSACTGKSPVVKSGSSEGPSPDFADLAPSLYEGLDKAAIALADATVQNVLEQSPSQQTVPWHSDVAGVSGSVTAVRTFRTTEGLYCREFLETVTSLATERSARRLACRMPGGSWRPAQRAKPK